MAAEAVAASRGDRGADAAPTTATTDAAATASASAQRAAYPTPAMVAFFEARTAAHIACVRTHMGLMAGYLGLTAAELDARGAAHDASKYVEPERSGYIVHSWRHRCRLLGEPEEPAPLVDLTTDGGDSSTVGGPGACGPTEGGGDSGSSGVSAKIDVAVAIRHHLTTNRHHHESHATPDDMSDLDLVEMAADLTAISRENGADTCNAWAEANVPRFGFSAAGLERLWTAIRELNTRLAAAGMGTAASTWTFKPT